VESGESKETLSEAAVTSGGVKTTTAANVALRPEVAGGTTAGAGGGAKAARKVEAEVAVEVASSEVEAAVVLGGRLKRPNRSHRAM